MGWTCPYFSLSTCPPQCLCATIWESNLHLFSADSWFRFPSKTMNWWFQDFCSETTAIMQHLICSSPRKRMWHWRSRLFCLWEMWLLQILSSETDPNLRLCQGCKQTIQALRHRNVLSNADKGERDRTTRRLKGSWRFFYLFTSDPHSSHKRGLGSSVEAWGCFLRCLNLRHNMTPFRWANVSLNYKHECQRTVSSLLLYLKKKKKHLTQRLLQLNRVTLTESMVSFNFQFSFQEKEKKEGKKNTVSIQRFISLLISCITL